MKKTEQRNQKTMNIDKVSTLEAVKMMNEEDKTVAYAVEKVLDHIAEAVDLIVDSFNKGGRLLYIGAGTSGRLGVMDAAECGPTFGVEFSQVQGIIAGGYDCMFKPSENKEDEYEAGVNDCKQFKVSKNDTLVGLSVAGDARYVLGAIEYARSLGAHTVAVTCNEDAKILAVGGDVGIFLDTGPEVITGSTRLKAGTAQKMVCNMLTTISMVKTGKVRENLMVNVQPSNEKLFNRCVRIIREMVDIPEEVAREALRLASHKLPIKTKFVKKENIGGENA